MARDRQDLLDKAERLASRGKLNAAITEFRKVIDAYPQDTSTLNRVGDLYVRLKRIDARGLGMPGRSSASTGSSH
jgi:Flp pilus assembly protein TadD